MDVSRAGIVSSHVSSVLTAYLVYEMVKYAQNYKTCRKVLFEKYFTLDSSVNSEDTLVNKITPDQPCGICDNCTRPKEQIVVEDIHSTAETIIRLCIVLQQHNERVTMPKLVQMLLGRGLGIMKTRVMNDKKIQVPIRKYSEYVGCFISEQSLLLTAIIICRTSNVF